MSTDRRQLMGGIAAVAAAPRSALARPKASRATTLGAAPGALQVVGTPSRLGKNVSLPVGANSGCAIRFPFYIGSADASQLVFSFANLFATMLPTATGNAVIIDAVVIEKDGGGWAPVTFGGAASVTVNWAQSDVQSDPIWPGAGTLGQSVFRQNDLYWWKILYHVNASTYAYPVAYDNAGVFPGAQAYAYPPGAAPAIDATGEFDTRGLTLISGPFWGPIVLGVFTRPARSFGAVGDSVFRDSDVATAATAYPLNLFEGVFERALVDPLQTSWLPGAGPNNAVNLLAGLNMAVFGSKITGYTMAGDARAAYYQYCTDIVEEYGTNDYTASVKPAVLLAMLQASLSALWRAMQQNGVARIWRTRILQRTHSSDAWATVAHQTYQGSGAWCPGGVYDQLNHWFDGQVGGLLAGVFAHSRPRDQADPWKWAVNDATLTGVGIKHWPTQTGVHPSIYSGVAQLADELRSDLLAGPGAAIPAAPSGVSAGASDTTITLVWSPAAAVSNYVVRYCPSGSGAWTTIQTYDYAAGYCLQNLPPSTAYDFQVAAANYAGLGPWSPVTTVTTLVQPQGLPLDLLATAATAAYSSRRLSGAWTGPLERWRRDIDGRETDVYANATNDLDTAWLAAFLNGGGGRVKRLYDQTGGGHHFNANYANLEINSWPVGATLAGFYSVAGHSTKLYDAAANTSFLQSTLTAAPGLRSVVCVVETETLGASQAILGGYGATNGFELLLDASGRVVLQSQRGRAPLVASSVTLPPNSPHVVSVVYNAVNNGIWIDGTAVGASSTAGGFTGTVASLGCSTSSAGAPFNGFIPEVVVFDNQPLPASDRAALESSMAAYWLSS